MKKLLGGMALAALLGGGCFGAQIDSITQALPKARPVECSTGMPFTGGYTIVFRFKDVCHSAKNKAPDFFDGPQLACMGLDRIVATTDRTGPQELSVANDLMLEASNKDLDAKDKNYLGVLTFCEADAQTWGKISGFNGRAISQNGFILAEPLAASTEVVDFTTDCFSTGQGAWDCGTREVTMVRKTTKLVIKSDELTSNQMGVEVVTAGSQRPLWTCTKLPCTVDVDVGTQVLVRPTPINNAVMNAVTGYSIKDGEKNVCPAPIQLNKPECQVDIKSLNESAGPPAGTELTQKTLTLGVTWQRFQLKGVDTSQFNVVPSSPDGYYNFGTQVKVAHKTAPCVNWGKCPGVQSGLSCIVNMDSDKEVRGQGLLKYTFNLVRASSSAGGVVNSNISDLGLTFNQQSSSVQVCAGTVVTLTAVGNFKEWIEGCVSTSPTCTLTVNTNVQVCPVFLP